MVIVDICLLESGDSSDWSSSEEEEDPYAGSPLRPSLLANKTAQWEWRSQEEGQSHHTTSQQHVLPKYGLTPLNDTAVLYYLKACFYE